MIGMFAISKAGHDKGQLYIIIEEEGDFVYLSDGKNKMVDSPKKKRKKHVQPVKKGMDAVLAEKLKSRHPVTNEEIKHAIKIRTMNLKE